MAMEAITSTQISKLRIALKESQEVFAERMGVSGSSVGNWETGVSNPRGENRKNLIELYCETFWIKAKISKTSKNGVSNGGHAKGGRTKVSSVRVQERLAHLDSHMMAITTEAVAREIAKYSEFEFASFREALVVFLYKMDNLPSKEVAISLSGHE